jgi:hypothetical protein
MVNRRECPEGPAMKEKQAIYRSDTEDPWIPVHHGVSDRTPDGTIDFAAF